MCLLRFQLREHLLIKSGNDLSYFYPSRKWERQGEILHRVESCLATAVQKCNGVVVSVKYIDISYNGL